VPVQAFVDESGGNRKNHHLVMAGLISNSEDWAEFSDEWRACLNAPRSIRYLKMSEAAALGDQFHGWEIIERNDKLTALAEVINRHAKAVVFHTIDLHVFRLAAKNQPKPFNQPYFNAFHKIIWSICMYLWETRWREEFEIIFDQHEMFGPKAKEWYPFLKHLMGNTIPPDAHAMLPAEPMFRDDQKFLPLQAADLFAWGLRNEANIHKNQQLE
jgi:hypothetical protein